MKISECFYSIQGEGPTMGESAVFLRLQGCNLRCNYCDTKYTWNLKEGKEWTVTETAKQIKKTWGCSDKDKIKRLVITGGEPLLYKEQIDELLKILMTEDKWDIEIETNGTIEPTRLQIETCQFNCSPKLANSGNEWATRFNLRALRLFSEFDINSNFKFVVSEPSDLEEIEVNYIKILKIPRNKIILMPLGISPDELRKSTLGIIEYAKKKGFRVLSRLQIETWGKKRMV